MIDVAKPGNRRGDRWIDANDMVWGIFRRNGKTQKEPMFHMNNLLPGDDWRKIDVAEIIRRRSQ